MYFNHSMSNPMHEKSMRQSNETWLAKVYGSVEIFTLSAKYHRTCQETRDRKMDAHVAAT